MFNKLIVCVLLVFPQFSHAEIGVALGINITFDFEVGITVKALSSDKIDEFVVAVGATYYPISKNKIGFDIGFGRTAILNTVFLYGIDIYKDSSYMSVGYVNLSSQSASN